MKVILADEIAVPLDRLKREILAGKHKQKELLEAKVDIDTLRSDRTVILQKIKYIPRFGGTEDNIED